MVSGRKADVLDRLAGDLRGRGVRAVALSADLGDLEQIEPLVDRAEAALGPIDLLVNNAGIENTGSFTRLTRDQLTAMVDINLTAPMLLTHAALPGMLRRGWGHVVFISSVAGKQGVAYNVPYSTTKAGLVLLAQSLRAEYASSPVGFSVVCPGFVAGDGMYQRMVDSGLKASRLLGTTTTDRVAAKVIGVIRKDKPEVLVNSVPLRGILALGQLAPRLVERVAPMFGADTLFRQAAADRGTLETAVDG